ncbi:MAG: RecX family transcriptional regulator [Acidobacteria bacterium]|nr:RecX family transcriptional regulator [Acidobacteriota bacterium]
MTSRHSSSAPDADSLYEATVKALARRARSSGELRQYLLKRHATKTQIEAILKRLRENGYLDDARFARAFAASRLQNDLHGPVRVGRDLAARRVRPEIARQALDAAYEGIDEGELLSQYLRRKAGRSRLPDKPSALATLYRRLLRAGFRSATIVRELRRLLPEPPS